MNGSIPVAARSGTEYKRAMAFNRTELPFIKEQAKQQLYINLLQKGIV